MEDDNEERRTGLHNDGGGGRGNWQNTLIRKKDITQQLALKWRDKPAAIRRMERMVEEEEKVHVEEDVEKEKVEKKAVEKKAVEKG